MIEALYSGQARALVTISNGKLKLYKLDDASSDDITSAEMRNVFFGCDDVKSARVATTIEALRIAVAEWRAVRGVINLSLILTAADPARRGALYRPNAEMLQDIFIELADQLDDEAVFDRVTCTICLQYMFFKQNEKLVDLLGLAATKFSQLPKKYSGPIARLSRWFSCHRDPLALLKTLVFRHFGPEDPGIEDDAALEIRHGAYTLLAKSDVIGKLVQTISEDLTYSQVRSDQIPPLPPQLNKRTKYFARLYDLVRGGSNEFCLQFNSFLNEIEVSVVQHSESRPRAKVSTLQTAPQRSRDGYRMRNDEKILVLADDFFPVLHAGE